MARDYSDVPDLETARRLLVAYDETTRKCVDEIERLREYERLVKFISSDYIELSHEKVAWQRDDWRRRCRALQQKGTE